MSALEFNGLCHQCRGLGDVWFVKLSTVAIREVQQRQGGHVGREEFGDFKFVFGVATKSVE